MGFENSYKKTFLANYMKLQMQIHCNSPINNPPLPCEGARYSNRTFTIYLKTAIHSGFPTKNNETW